MMARLGDYCDDKIDTLSSNYNGLIDYIDISLVDNKTKHIIGTQTLDAKEAPSRAKQLVSVGDVLVSTVRPNLNAIAIVESASENALVASTGYCVLRTKKQLLNRYAFYYCQSPTFVDNMTKQATGASYPAVSASIIKECDIPIPSIDVQNEIVTRLNQITSLIALRKKQLQKLDDLVKARFVEMFGDESNPKQWPIINVEDVADVSVGVVIKPAQYYTDAEHGVKAFRSLNVGPMKIKDGDWVYFSHEGNEKNAKSQLKENDLLIVRSGAPGTACVVAKQYEGCNAVDIIIARPDINRVNPYYLCAYTNMPHGKKQIEEGTGGAAQQHFNVGKYNKLQLMLPPMECQNMFVELFGQVNKSKLSIQQGLEKLETLKKSLMQQYFG